MMRPDQVRYLLRLTWRWQGQAVPAGASVSTLALLLRDLGFHVTPVCRGSDHGSFRLRPDKDAGLPLGEALTRLQAAELDAGHLFPGEWEVSVELPCPRRKTAFGQLPALACAAA